MNSESAAAVPAGRKLVFLALAPFAVGYFFSYLFRAVNAVVEPYLVDELSLSATVLGLLTASYFFAFALAQLPMGIFLDRFGPRKVQVVLLSTAAVGSMLFAVAGTAWALTVARALIGLGFAGGLMAGFKAVALWVRAERRAFANALVMSFGALGLLVSTEPTKILAEMIGWRDLFRVLAAGLGCAVLLIWFAVPENRPAGAPQRFGEQVKGLGQILRSGVFWRIVPFTSLTAGVHVALQTLWAGPWLRDVAGLDSDGVARMLLIMAIAFWIGIVASGAVADWLTRRGINLLLVMSGYLVTFLVAQVALLFGATGFHMAAWCVFAMTGQCAVLAYPWLANHFGAERAGRANTAANLMMFLTAFASQSFVGVIIDLFPASAGGGFAPEAYRAAIGLFLVLQLLSFVWFLAGRPWRRSEGESPA